MISKFPHPEQHTVFLPSPLVPYATSCPPLCHRGSFQIRGVRFRLFASESALLVSESACCSFRILVSESVLVLVSESAVFSFRIRAWGFRILVSESAVLVSES